MSVLSNDKIGRDKFSFIYETCVPQSNATRSFLVSSFNFCFYFFHFADNLEIKRPLPWATSISKIKLNTTHQHTNCNRSILQKLFLNRKYLVSVSSACVQSNRTHAFVMAAMLQKNRNDFVYVRRRSECFILSFRVDFLKITKSDFSVFVDLDAMKMRSTIKNIFFIAD